MSIPTFSLIFDTVLLCVSDGLIDHENEELRERVQSLEKRVQQQEDEIVCLKSALADVIRRLSQVEAGRGEANTPKGVMLSTFNPSNAKATVVQSTRMQRFLKNI